MIPFSPSVTSRLFFESSLLHVKHVTAPLFVHVACNSFFRFASVGKLGTGKAGEVGGDGRRVRVRREARGAGRRVAQEDPHLPSEPSRSKFHTGSNRRTAKEVHRFNSNRLAGAKKRIYSARAREQTQFANSTRAAIAGDRVWSSGNDLCRLRC